MKKLLTVAFLSGLLTLVRMASGMIIAKALAVYTGPTGMAMLGQVQNIVASLNGVVNAPVGSGVVRYTAEFAAGGIEGCAPWWRACLWWLAVILCVVMPAGLIFAVPLAQSLLHDAKHAWLIRVVTLLLPLAALGTLFNSVINGYQQFRRYFALGAIATVMSCMLIVLLIVLRGINGALLGAAVQASLFGVIVSVAVCRQPWLSLRYFWGRATAEHKKKVGGYVLIALASALTMPLAAICVRNVIVANVGWEAAGQWQAVWKISEVYLSVITMAVGTYVLPRLALLKGGVHIRQEINQVALFFFPVAAAMALGIYFFRDILIATLFTGAFTAARDFFAIQLVGDVIKFAGWLYAYPMLSRGATRWFLITEVVFSSTFILFSWWLVPLFLVQGVNLAYMINYFIYLLVAFLSLRYWLK